MNKINFNKVIPVSSIDVIDNDTNKRMANKSHFETLLTEAMLKNEEKRISENLEKEKRDSEKNVPVKDDINLVSIQQSYLISSLNKEENEKKENLNKNKFLLKEVAKAYK